MKKLKLVISALLAISVIFASTIVASAASMGVSLSASKTSLKPGDTVTITVNLSSNTGIGGVDFTLKYNSTHLSYQSASVSGVGSSFGWNNVSQSSASVVNGAFLMTDGNAMPSTGALATVTFKVIAPSNATSNVSVSAEGTDADGVPTASSSSSVNLTITAETTTQPTTKPSTQPSTTPTTTKPTTTETTTEGTTTPEESTTKILDTTSIGVTVGNTYQLAAVKGMTGKIVYSSSNPGVVSVRDNGIVTTHVKGMATIKAVSENGITKTWLLIVGDGSTVEEESSTTEDESTTDLEIIGGEDVSNNNTIVEEKTTAETDDEKNNNHDDEDEVLKIIIIAGSAAALIAIIIVIVSLVRKKKSFEG